jgi:UDP-GlcNAc:undecaprenyl-phosphate/decaprenyl-phosphate GlcNAc-1-phosphate transferase
VNESLVLGAFLLPFGAALVATPAAIKAAWTLDFYDRPAGWKTHSRPTPYLGGAAVTGAFVLGLLASGAEGTKAFSLATLTALLWAVGTLDDRRGVHWALRLGTEAGAGALLWAAGVGWSVFPSEIANLALTTIWIAAVVNALNLLDLMDGVASTVAAVSAAGAGALALAGGDEVIAAAAFSLSGACLGFLPYNLGRPARIFLGDGGSMPIGFVVGAVLMAIPVEPHGEWTIFLTAGVLFGIPLLDMGFRVLSRIRRGVALLHAGPDSLANYLERSVGSARAVAASLGALQALLCLTALGALELGGGSVVAAWSVWFIVGTATVTLLEVRVWRPEAPDHETDSEQPRRELPAQHHDLLPAEALLIAFIAISCGLSPLLYGFYDISVWGPIALAVLAGLMGLVIARPAVPRRAALAALATLVGLWLWSLLSVGWAESADQAITDANRWLLYAALFGLLILLLRDDRLGIVLVGAGAAAIFILGIYITVRLLAGGGDELFVYGRLNEPLGYINGQAGYLLMGFWPFIALAERARHPVLAGAGVAGATFLGALVLLPQTRAVVPAAAASTLLLLAAVPGRTTRAWALVAAGAGIAACAGPVLDVYDSFRSSGAPDDDQLRDAALAIVLASSAAGLVWAAAMGATGRLRGWIAPMRPLAWAPLGLAAVVLVAAVLAGTNDPVGKLRQEYRSFTELRGPEEGESRFTSGGGNRYDYWRVAVNQFTDDPLKGVGAGNYDRTYFLERRTTEDIRQAHSIELQTLGELGLVGGLLLAVFVLAIAAGFIRRAREARDDLQVRGLAVAAGGTFVVWFVHTSVDWLHLIPGITGIALCSAAVLVGPWRRQRTGGSDRGRVAIVTVCGIAVLAGAVLVGRAALADRYVNDGRDVLNSDPAAAIDKARDSLDLNDEDLDAYYLESAAWARLGNYRRARDALAEATRREPHDFVTWALLGDLSTRRGDHRQALRDYRRAAALNPRDDALSAAAGEARARLREG